MSNAKTLNFADLAPSNRTLTLAGQTFPVLEMTVQSFLETVKEAEAMKSETDPAAQIDKNVDMILRYVPSCPRDVLLKCSFEQLGMIMAFVQDNLDVDEAGNPIIKSEVPAAGAVEADPVVAAAEAGNVEG